MRDAARGVYKRVVVKDDRLIGAVLYGDTADGNWYFDLLKKGEDIAEHPRRADLRPGLRRWRWRRPDPNAAVAALADDAEICGCNGVSKGKVVAGHRGRRGIARRGALELQGIGVVRLLHRPCRERC